MFDLELILLVVKSLVIGAIAALVMYILLDVINRKSM